MAPLPRCNVLQEPGHRPVLPAKRRRCRPRSAPRPWRRALLTRMDRRLRGTPPWRGTGDQPGSQLIGRFGRGCHGRSGSAGRRRTRSSRRRGVPTPACHRRRRMAFQATSRLHPDALLGRPAPRARRACPNGPPPRGALPSIRGVFQITVRGEARPRRSGRPCAAARRSLFAASRSGAGARQFPSRLVPPSEGERRAGWCWRRTGG
jgi:hypothetical protein